MVVLITALLFVLSVALQGSVLALVGTAGVHPDFLLVVTVSLGILGGTRNGAVIGASAGLLQDILFGSPLGFFAAVKMLIGALAGMVADDIYKDMTAAPMTLIVFFSFFADLLTYLLMKLFALPISYTFSAYLQQYVPVRIAYHFLLTGIVYPPLYRAQRRQVLFPEKSFEE
ncbi:MAG: rod shape-determining protein MreD [Firmicutes bacterium]|jgi:rod shape-determining protein MreD|nr:rod shape-determining protein MreD [Bacillota bacterium]